MAPSRKQKQRSRASATRPAHIGAAHIGAAHPGGVRATTAEAPASKPTAAHTAQTDGAGQETGADVPMRRSDSVDWPNEYSYVIGDLKQMTVVTVGLFAALIVIGYFL